MTSSLINASERKNLFKMLFGGIVSLFYLQRQYSQLLISWEFSYWGFLFRDFFIRFFFLFRFFLLSQFNSVLSQCKIVCFSHFSHVILALHINFFKPILIFLHVETYQTLAKEVEKDLNLVKRRRTFFCFFLCPEKGNISNFGPEIREIIKFGQNLNQALRQG